MKRKPRKFNIDPDGDTSDVLANLCQAIKAIGQQNATTLRVLRGHDGAIVKHSEHLVALHESVQALQAAIHALADRIGQLEHRFDHRHFAGDHDAAN